MGRIHCRSYVVQCAICIAGFLRTKEAAVDVALLMLKLFREVCQVVLVFHIA